MWYLCWFFVYLFSDSHGTSRHSSRMPFRRPRSPKHEELYVEAAARRERHQAESFSAFKMTKMNKMVDDACFFPYHVPINHFTDLTIIFPFFRIFSINFPSFYQFNHHFTTIFKSSPLFNHHFQGFPITFPHFSLTVPGTLGAVHAVATAIWGWRATAMAETWCLFVTALLNTMNWWVNGVYNTINPLWYAMIWLWLWFWYDYDYDYDYDIVQSCLIGENGAS